MAKTRKKNIKKNLRTKRRVRKSIKKGGNRNNVSLKQPPSQRSAKPVFSVKTLVGGPFGKRLKRFFEKLKEEIDLKHTKHTYELKFQLLEEQRKKDEEIINNYDKIIVTNRKLLEATLQDKSSLEKELNTLFSEFKNAYEEKERLQTLIDGFKQEQNKKTKATFENITFLHATNEQQAALISKLREEITNLENSLTAKDQQIEEAQEEKNHYEEIFQKHLEETDNLRKQLSNAEKDKENPEKIEALEIMIYEMEQIIKDKNDNEETFKAKMQNLLNELHNASSDNAKLKKDIQELREQQNDILTRAIISKQIIDEYKEAYETNKQELMIRKINSKLNMLERLPNMKAKYNSIMSEMQESEPKKLIREQLEKMNDDNKQEHMKFVVDDYTIKIKKNITIAKYNLIMSEMQESEQKKNIKKKLNKMTNIKEILLYMESIVNNYEENSNAKNNQNLPSK